ncbi:unnamed protein product [Didymodactylos carnosus]|uniref:Phosphoglycerate mutase n=1 Tax=Didymodactylos carnosus TaxID=1234261 RepID=A0A814AEV1_9BILA|nr:unnamed protein product [Didymodactylos carnosus]CAF1199122.1 unnamed protein product [Didymodactylos carnosus]CAF3693056.1 unnamed protein product [Didymodactylos carnosus]CAF4009242.1 unnamed protein product [Didymodactylos carnosus]
MSDPKLNTEKQAVDQISTGYFKHFPLSYFPSIYVTDAKPQITLPLDQLNLYSEYNWNQFNDDFNQLTLKYNSSVKCLYFIRHAVGFHNEMEERVGTEQWERVIAKTDQFFDANLTERGKMATRSLRDKISLAMEQGLKIDMIVTSPLSRAIQTAEIALESLFKSNTIPVYSHEYLRETMGIHTCDKRRTKSELELLYPHINFDGLISEEDTLWNANERETDDSRLERATEFLQWLWKFVDAKHIAIFGHSGILQSCTIALGAIEGGLLSNDRGLGFKLGNCEFISVVARQYNSNQDDLTDNISLIKCKEIKDIKQ